MIRFVADGTFAMDYGRGDLDNPGTAEGTYELDGTTITFVNEGTGFCPTGATWAWEARLIEKELHVEWTDGACDVETGTIWTLARRLTQG